MTFQAEQETYDEIGDDNISGDTNTHLVDVPDYATTDDATRALMDTYIETIDLEDFQNISKFGSEELERLSAVANGIREKSDASVLDIYEEAQEAMESIDVSGLTSKAANMGMSGAKWVVKNPGTAIASVGAGAVLGPLALVGVPMAKRQMDRLKAKRDGSDIADKLRKDIQKTDTVFNNLLSARQEIASAVGDLNKLGVSRLESYQTVSVLIGAGLEKLRRADEEEIPALQEQSSDGMTALKLENIMLGRDALHGHIVNMIAGRSVSQATVVVLSSAKKAFQQAVNKIDTHLTVSKPQWDAQAAEAGVMLAAEKGARIVADADKHGNAMLENSARLGTRVSEMMRESARVGTYDPTKVIAVMDEVAENVKRDAIEFAGKRDSLEKAQLLLAGAEGKFAEKVARFQEKGADRLKLTSSNANGAEKSLPAPKQG